MQHVFVRRFWDVVDVVILTLIGTLALAIWIAVKIEKWRNKKGDVDGNS